MRYVYYRVHVLQVHRGGQLRGDHQDAAQRAGTRQTQVPDPGTTKFKENLMQCMIFNLLQFYESLEMDEDVKYL